MKLILEVNRPNAADAAQQILRDWSEEHSDYYGRPHGARSIWIGLSAEHCGFSECRVPLANLFQTPVDGFRWLTCGGNDHRLAIHGECVYLAFDGRRNGMRGEFVEFLKEFYGKCQKKVYFTCEVNWLPWQTLNEFLVECNAIKSRV